jgi:hypothetical protein
MNKYEYEYVTSCYRIQSTARPRSTASDNKNIKTLRLKGLDLFIPCWKLPFGTPFPRGCSGMNLLQLTNKIVI